jgi:hypothetical protein
MDNLDLINEVDKNQYNHFIYLAKLNNHIYKPEKNYSYVKSGKEVWCNFVFDLKNLDHDVIEELKSKIISKEIPDNIVADLNFPYDKQDGILISKYFKKSIESRGMILKKNNFKYNLINENLKIKKCNSFDELMKWSSLVVNFLFKNGTDQNIKDFAWMILPCLKQNNYAVYLGYLNDEPVASSACYFENNTGGIYFVTVSDKFRKMGLGYEITAKCIIDGIDKGTDYYILQATDLGKSVYAKLGFEDVGIKRRFVLQ